MKVQLHHIAISRHATAALEAAGEDASGLEAFESAREHSVDDLITHELDVSERTALKYEAMLQHRTQLGADSVFSKVPFSLHEKLMAQEYLIQVQAPLPPATPPRCKW